MTVRPTASTINDAQLDALYERLAKAERAVNLLADSHRRAEQAEELLRIAHDTSNKSEAERARAAQRADRAEAAITRVRQLAERIHQGAPWTANTADTAAHIHAALDEPEEQLPADILALLAPNLPAYTSTACVTGRALAEVIADHPESTVRLNVWRPQLHARCRLNHKFTGQPCDCWCHHNPAEEQQ